VQPGRDEARVRLDAKRAPGSLRTAARARIRSLACRDFGLDATLTTRDRGAAGRSVTWRYSDATSPEGVGLRVVQRSYDGKPPADYVLFHFTFTNTSRATRTFYAGFYGDWDLDDIGDHSNDIGFTDLGGRLMYMTNEGETGVHAGTLLLADFPVAGNYFYGNPGPPAFPLTDQFGALSGSLTRTATDAPRDNRYLHAVGPITLRRGKSAEVWVVIVAGENRAQLLANAAFAERDVMERRDIEERSSGGARQP